MGYYTTYHLDIQGKGIDFDKYEIFEEIGIISGYGEENGDIWRKYFKNGKTHFSKAKIVFDDFDPEKF